MGQKRAQSGFNPSPSDLDYLNVSGSGVITINGWETGYLGNADYIPILPSDLIINTANNTGRTSGQTNMTEIGHYGNDGGYKEFSFIPSAQLPPKFGYVGQKIIPKGFKVTSVSMSGSGGGWRIATGSINNDSSGLVAGTAGIPLIINTTHVFSTPLEGDGLLYISFNFDPTATSHQFWGGKLFMEKI